MSDKEIKVLSDRDWLLIRGHNIIGSLQPTTQKSFLFNKETSKFEWSEYSYIQGLNKIINEIIDNSLDVAIKSNFEFANQISVEISHNKVTVSDNGYGIPVIQNQNKDWLPAIAWGQARAGSNFEEDEERTSVGMNGIGSFATTVFSTKFTGVTDDGKNRLSVKFKNNCESFTIDLQPSSKQGTSVSFMPDLSRFGVEEIDELHQSLIYQRLLNLSILYPQIKFKFNRRLIKMDAKKFLGLFSDSFEFLEDDNSIIAVFPNDSSEFNFHTYVNGLWLEKGGNHLDFVSKRLVDELRNKLIRKYKMIKPGDIKNKISCVVFFRNFKNPKFDGQTKEFLTNTQKEITSFLNLGDISTKAKWVKFATKVYKNTNIIHPIQDLYNAKMLVEEKRKLKDAVKKQDLPDKYWPATSKNKNLIVAEGDSAIDAIIAEISREENGFFPLKGVPLNVIRDSKKLSTNAELKQLAGILGMDLTTISPPLLPEGDFYEINIDINGEQMQMIVNINDEIYDDKTKEWIKVRTLLE